jgi:hypothetical protein
MLPGTRQVLNDSPTNQVDAHIDGKLVAYTDWDAQPPEFVDTSQVRYYDLATNTDHPVPGNEFAFHSDVSAGRIVFDHLTTSAWEVVVFDTASQTRAIIPDGGSWPSIGGNTVAIWGRTTVTGDTRIRAYDLSTGTSTQLTDDNLTDVFTSVSPDGNGIVWQKCEPFTFNCDIYVSTQTSPGVLTTRQLTGPGRDERRADTDGKTVAYVCRKPDEPSDVCFQSLAGGTETRLSIPGFQQSVRVSGDFITFTSEFALPDSPFNWDIFLYEISTATLYKVTHNAAISSGPDIFVGDGVGRIVYSEVELLSDASSWDLHAVTFPAPSSIEDEINDLIELVESFDLPQGTENSLVAKLQDALAAVEASQTATACDCLSDFINECAAQSGKKLTADQASQLINSATQIKTDLGCQ